MKKKMDERISELETLVQNMQMATQMSQMLLQKLLQNNSKIDADISNAMGVMNDLQYRTLAMIETNVFDKAELDVIADTLKEKDFNEASDSEDAKKGWTPGVITTEESVVIVTSTTESEVDAGIFRSKFAIKDAVLPELKEKLVGLKVGDSAIVNITGTDHNITVLGIRDIPVEPAEQGEPSPEVPVAEEIPTAE